MSTGKGIAIAALVLGMAHLASKGQDASGLFIILILVAIFG